jgi:hypothetical protein
MPEDKKRSITNTQGGGVFQSLSMRIKLIMRLMGDSRVNPLYKLLPVGAMLLDPYRYAPGPIDDERPLGTILRRTLPPEESRNIWRRSQVVSANGKNQRIKKKRRRAGWEEKNKASGLIR